MLKKRLLERELVIAMVGPDKKHDYALFGPVEAKYTRNMRGASIYRLGTYDTCLETARRMQEKFPNWTILDET